MAIPQIKTLAQLQGFDYTKFGDFYGANKGDSLDGLRSIFGYFMHPSMPLLAALAYLLLSKPMCVALRTLCGHSYVQKELLLLSKRLRFSILLYLPYLFSSVLKTTS